MATFYNRATLRFGGENIHSNTVQGEFESSLALDLSAVPNRYRPGDRVAYVVTLTNSGASDAEGLRLTDDLGAYAFGDSGMRTPLTYVDGSARYFVDGVLQDAPDADATTGELVFRDVRVPANGDAALVYAVRVNEYAPLGAESSIVSTVTLSGAGNSALNLAPQPNVNANARSAQQNPAGANMLPREGNAPELPFTASEEILPETGAHLSVAKRLSPETVSAGQTLTYTLTIENSGASPVLPEDGAVLTDVFDPILDIASVRYDGEAWGAENYSYDRNAGLFATAEGRLDVPAATFAQDGQTGEWRVTPGVRVIEIEGSIR